MCKCTAFDYLSSWRAGGVGKMTYFCETIDNGVWGAFGCIIGAAIKPTSGQSIDNVVSLEQGFCL